MTRAKRGTGGGQRPQRVGEQIRQVLGELLMSGAIKEPRLAEADLVSCTEVRVTSDLRVARVFISVFPSDEATVETVMRGLEEAQPRIKSLLAKEVRLRHTPDLRFTSDRSIERGAHMEALIRQVKEEDAALRAEDRPDEGADSAAEEET